MFCINCGKQNVDGASFCAHCGKAVAQSSVPVPLITKEWEYNFYRRTWESGKGGRWNLLLGQTEYSVRLDNWGNDQSRVMSEIQEYLDNGWQLINSPGPGSYRFREHTDYASTIKFKWLEVSSFVVEFRRPARPRTDKEKQILGTWQETHDPNKGFWNTLGNAVFSQKLKVNRDQYEFRKDRAFQRIDRDGQKRSEGIFYETQNGEIHLFNKFWSDHDATLFVSGNKLTVKSKGRRPFEYERVE